LELANVLIGCNNAHLVLEDRAWKVIGDPTEGALLSAGHKAGGSKERLESEMPKRHEIPFDSDRKRRSVVRLLSDGRLRAFINGAPDLLLERCTKLFTGTGVRPLTDADREEITARNSALAAQALRVLGSAYRDLDPASPETLTAEDIEQDLVFVGLTGMYDPPRPEVKDAAAKCRAAGIRVVMITGDHPHTAMAIARELGIATGGDVALAGTELDRLSDEELREQAPRIAVYARVTAEHKLRIVRAWKARNAVVAMTGDGVNDAPAIKGADIGIAMGRSGTEVTKQASAMIITDDNFTSIVAAVEEGRGIYDNIRKTLQYLLAGNTGELLLMTLCVVIGLPTPLLPIHLLWINLVTDGLPALCLATDPIDPDVMSRRPRPRKERITDSGFLSTMFLTGALTAGVSFVVYLYGLRTETPEMARTHAFAALVFAELLRSFGARSETRPLWRMNLFSNLNLLLVVVISFSIQLWSHHNAWLASFLKTSLLPVSDCLMLLAVSVLPLLFLEARKVSSRHSTA
jgi:Ca2+-transporting ATPase